METKFEQFLNKAFIILLITCLLIGVITMMRWNLQNDEKRNQLWEQNLKACGVEAYQNESGVCIKINNQ